MIVLANLFGDYFEGFSFEFFKFFVKDWKIVKDIKEIYNI